MDVDELIAVELHRMTEGEYGGEALENTKDRIAFLKSLKE